MIKNSTLQDYNIKVVNNFDRNVSKTLVLGSGELLPLPESYNQAVIQFKLADCEEWSSEWHVYAIKNIIQPEKAGYLQHGTTYTFFRKQAAEYSGTFNVNLMPPLVLKNCLPCDLHLQFVDSNNVLCKMALQKEQVKNVFQFDLQKEIKLQVCIPGYNFATLSLSNKVELLEEVQGVICLTDLDGCKLEIQYTKSSKTAGFALSFFI